MPQSAYFRMNADRRPFALPKENGRAGRRDSLPTGSDLAPEAARSLPRQEVPMSNGTGPAPTWEGRIKGMLAPFVTCMKSDLVFNKIGRTIDLSDYDQVVANGIIIYGMIKNQRMPPGAPLPPEDIDAFHAWMKADYPKE